MGSYSLSQNSSSTNYTNAPITQDGDNPLALYGSSGNKISGGNDNSILIGSGASLNTTTLDGGAIDRAFAFGSQAITTIADLTQKFNQNQQNLNSNALGIHTDSSAAAAAGAAGAAGVVSENGVFNFGNERTIVIAVVGFAVAYLIYKGRK